MSLKSRLFPSDAAKLERARNLIERDKLAEARTLLLRIPGRAAEQLYEQATKQSEELEQARANAKQVAVVIESARAAHQLVREVDPMRVLAEAEQTRQNDRDRTLPRARALKRRG